MSEYAELVGKYLIPFGTARILNMPYACYSSQKCAPYKVNLHPGKYIIELWGASGGDTLSLFNSKLIRGGLGGYVKGTLIITAPMTLFFFIGAKGRASATASYNGGGIGFSYDSKHDVYGTGGGGATDVRLFPPQNDDELEEASLLTRLMVAGAGGGACAYRSGVPGGSNLGLIGESGYISIYPGFDPGTPPTGGSQDLPGSGYITPTDYGLKGNSAGLGRGGQGLTSSTTGGAGAGGSGLFGGGSGGWANNVVSSGAGGSSFVNGCQGCKNFENLPKLFDPIIIGGNESMPSPLDIIDGSEEIGHYGNGFARITVEVGGFELPESCRRMKDKTFPIASIVLIGLLSE